MFVVRLISAIVISSCLLFASSVAANPIYTKAAVWSVGLNSSSVGHRSIADVKAKKRIYLETTNDNRIDDIIEPLKLEKMHCTGENASEDIWLVVELTMKDGSVKRLYADGDRLYSQDGRCSRGIKSSFRRKFDFLRECFATCRGSSLLPHTLKGKK